MRCTLVFSFTTAFQSRFKKTLIRRPRNAAKYSPANVFHGEASRAGCPLFLLLLLLRGPFTVCRPISRNVCVYLAILLTKKHDCQELDLRTSGALVNISDETFGLFCLKSGGRDIKKSNGECLLSETVVHMSQCQREEIVFICCG